LSTTRDERARPLGLATMSAELANARNYYRWLQALIEPHLGGVVLDVGTGRGDHLEPFVGSRRVVALEPDRRCAAELRARFADAGDFRVVDATAEDRALAERVRGAGIDTITCINVLEHVREQGEALANFHAVLRQSGGKLVLLVPAHRALFGAPDVAAGHYRRYEAADLRDALRRAGFDVVLLEHVNRLGALGWLISARVFPQRNLNAAAVSWQIRVFDRLIPLLRRLETFVRPPFGQSLLAVARPR
jgi:SAM-dependent methyltransferase